MWSLLGPVLPGLMSFPKVWRLHMSLIPSLFALRLAVLVVLMTSWISIWVDCCCWFVIFCFAHTHTSVNAHTSCSHTGRVWPTTWTVECVYALLLQMRVFTPGAALSVSSRLGVIVQWTDQGHADTAWESLPGTLSRFLTEASCQGPSITLQLSPSWPDPAQLGLSGPIPAPLLEISP